MEIWTRDGHRPWKRWEQSSLALEAVAGGAGTVVVVTDDPEDTPAAAAAARLARRVSPGPVSVSAGTAHPSARWLDTVRRAGADHAVLIRGSGNLHDSVEIHDGLCPALRSCRKQDVTISLCGRLKIDVALSPRHVEHWCLGAWGRCPHAGGALGG